MRDKNQRDKPWIFRTYAGHSTAADSNALYRKNLAKGQTGLSVAFDLPTQTGYNSDHVLAKGEVGKVGVPICHLGDMRTLFDGIPLDTMNTSMTINATAAWLMALYIAVADEQGAPRASLQGTLQNDIIKEYLSRGTYVFPPAPSMRLIKDVILFTTKEIPKWNPINVCSYHLQEAGATPVQELAFALATAIAVLDTVKSSGEVPPEKFGEVVGRISFFVNAGLRFITELCKMRAFTELWDEITRERYGITDAKQRLFRYGVQVNSLGLTEPQPENNVARILIEMLAVTLSKKRARARGPAAGVERSTWTATSVGSAVVAAHATDSRLRDRPARLRRYFRRLRRNHAQGRRTETAGARGVKADRGNGRRGRRRRHRLLEATAGRVEHGAPRGDRTRRAGCRRREQISRKRAIAAGRRPPDAILTVPEEAEHGQIERLDAWREARDNGAVAAALKDLKRAATSGSNIMPASIACAKAGVTTGEWGWTLREAFGEYRAPTGVGHAMRNDVTGLDDIRADVDRVSRKLGRRLTFLVGKPGLDGHSNGAEQIAVRARDAGMQVVYEGIRLTPEEIVEAARKQKAHVVGLSVLSGSHLPLVEDVVGRMKEAGLDVPVIVGGIIPPEDAAELEKAGVAAVYTPKDFELNRIMSDVVRIVERAKGASNV